MTQFCQLSDHSLIKISGADMQLFCQGQFTQNMDIISRYQGALSAYCNPKGRIISLYEIFQVNDAYYLSLTSSMADQMIETLQKYAIFSKVTLTKIANLQTFSLWGDNATEVIKDLSDIDLTSPYEVYSKDNITIIRLNTKTPSFKIFSTDDFIVSNADNVKKSAWHQFLIESHYPVITTDNSESFLPAELALDKLGAVSLSKGCYVGQEVIARMHYLGQTKKTLVTAKIVPANNDQLNVSLKDKILNQNQKSIGEIVNVTTTDSNEVEILAVVLKAQIEDVNTNQYHLKDTHTEVILKV